MFVGLEVRGPAAQHCECSELGSATQGSAADLSSARERWKLMSVCWIMGLSWFNDGTVVV